MYVFHAFSLTFTKNCCLQVLEHCGVAERAYHKSLAHLTSKSVQNMVSKLYPWWNYLVWHLIQWAIYPIIDAYSYESMVDKFSSSIVLLHTGGESNCCLHSVIVIRCHGLTLCPYGFHWWNCACGSIHTACISCEIFITNSLRMYQCFSLANQSSDYDSVNFARVLY